MATRYWIGTTDNWTTTTNWSDSTVPVTGDDIIFDGRAVTAPATNVETNDDFASVTVMSSYTLGMGGAGANEQVQFQCSGTVLIEGTGTYYLKCGDTTAADTDIVKTIINTTGTVYLASEKNAGAGNISEWTTVIVQNGTVYLYGGADGKGDASQEGCWVQNLYLAPKLGGNVTVNVGDECEDYKNGEQMTIVVAGGTLNISSDIDTITQFAGTVNAGTDVYSMDADDDNIATINLYGGTFNWLPSVVTGATPPLTAGTRTTASASPSITTLNMYKGTFSAASMLETLTTNPTIATCNLHERAVLNLDNSYNNFTVTTLNDFGGTIQKGAKQSLTIS